MFGKDKPEELKTDAEKNGEELIDQALTNGIFHGIKKNFTGMRDSMQPGDMGQLFGTDEDEQKSE